MPSSARRARRSVGALVGKDRSLHAGVDGAGVQALIEGHEADAGSIVAGEDGPLDRRGTTPARQERKMQVHHRHASEHIGADERPESHHDAELDARIEHVGHAARDREPELEARTSSPASA